MNRKSQFDLRSLIRSPLDEKLSTHLLSKNSEDFQSKAGAFRWMKIDGEADAVITNDELS